MGVIRIKRITRQVPGTEIKGKRNREGDDEMNSGRTADRGGSWLRTKKFARVINQRNNDEGKARQLHRGRSARKDTDNNRFSPIGNSDSISAALAGAENQQH